MTVEEALERIETLAEGLGGMERVLVREVLEQLSEDSWQRGINQAQEG